MLVSNSNLFLTELILKRVKAYLLMFSFLIDLKKLLQLTFSVVIS